MTKKTIENPNKNCLTGMSCPECGSFGPFAISVLVTVTMHDDGSDGPEGDQEWDENSTCTCVACKHSGKAFDFKDAALDLDDLKALGYEFFGNDSDGVIYYTYDDQGSEDFKTMSDALMSANKDAKELFSELSRCDNCGKLHSEQTVVEAKDLSMRTEPGGVIPSGECPDCGSLCYPIS